jgi:hypothetical protein
MADDLTFHPEDQRAGYTTGIGLAVLGFGCAALTFLEPGGDLPYLILGILLGTFGLVMLLPVARGYPRLRIAGGYVWLEGLWHRSEVLSLTELGEAHVVWSRARRVPRIALAFLRRDEDQALRESGVPIPTDMGAFYKVLPLNGLIPFNLDRAAEIASVVNEQRPFYEPTLGPTEKRDLVATVHKRQWRVTLTYFAVAGLFLVLALLLRQLR